MGKTNIIKHSSTTHFGRTVRGLGFEALLETEIEQGASIKLKELENRSRELELQVKPAELEIEQQKNKTGQK